MRLLLVRHGRSALVMHWRPLDRDGVFRRLLAAALVANFAHWSAWRLESWGGSTT